MNNSGAVMREWVKSAVKDILVEVHSFSEGSRAFRLTLDSRVRCTLLQSALEKHFGPTKNVTFLVTKIANVSGRFEYEGWYLDILVHDLSKVPPIG